MICDDLGFSGGMMLEEGIGSDYGIFDTSHQWIYSLDTYSLDVSTGQYGFGGSMWCYDHTSDVVMECLESGQDCLQDGDQCATDLDCCDQMFCSQYSGNCTDPVEYCHLFQNGFCIKMAFASKWLLHQNAADHFCCVS